MGRRMTKLVTPGPTWFRLADLLLAVIDRHLARRRR